MALVPVYNLKKEKVGEIELNDAIFNVPIKLHLLHEVIRWQLAKRRRGTACTKERNEVRGGGRKPWRQKGTGRARQGSIRSPIWRGGGIVFGPKPRDYYYPLPKRVRKNALKIALSLYLRDNKLRVLDKFELEEIKTKKVAQIFKEWGLNKVLVIDKKENEKLRLSIRNMPENNFLPPEGVNVYDILRHEELMITKDAIHSLEQKLL